MATVTWNMATEMKYGKGDTKHGKRKMEHDNTGMKHGNVSSVASRAVSYTHLTLPTKLSV